MKLFTLEETLEKYIGAPSTAKRKQFEEELRLDIIGGSKRQKQNSSKENLGN
jgi:hypothetical protein